jgi:hypothetical protein
MSGWVIALSIIAGVLFFAACFLSAFSLRKYTELRRHIEYIEEWAAAVGEEFGCDLDESMLSRYWKIWKPLWDEDEKARKARFKVVEGGLAKKKKE